MVLYWDIEVTSEDEDEMIRNIAHKIHEYELDMAAIIMIESVKPLSYIGTQMGRFFVSPFLSALGENIGISGEKFLQMFEKRENVEKLIKAVEGLTQEGEEQRSDGSNFAGKYEVFRFQHRRKSSLKLLSFGRPVSVI